MRFQEFMKQITNPKTAQQKCLNITKATEQLGVHELVKKMAVGLPGDGGFCFSTAVRDPALAQASSF